MLVRNIDLFCGRRDLSLIVADIVLYKYRKGRISFIMFSITRRMHFRLQVVGEIESSDSCAVHDSLCTDSIVHNVLASRVQINML